MFIRRFFSSVRLELQCGGKDASCLKLTEFCVPKPQQNDVLLKLAASPINPADRNVIQGTYPVKTPPEPFCLGNEGCFTVEEVGENVTSYKKGDMVIVLPKAEGGVNDEGGFFGCWTKHAVVSSDSLLKLPTNLTVAAAATVRVNPLTALCLLRKFVDLSEGDLVVQNGASSHIGQCIIQLCSSFGYKTLNLIAESEYSNSLKDDLKKLGADYVYTWSEWKDASKEFFVNVNRPKLGIDVLGGWSSYDVSRALSDGGKMVTIGNMSRNHPRLSAGDLIFKGKSFHGFWMTKWAAENRSEYEQLLKETICLAETGVLKEPLYTEFHPLENYHVIFEGKNKSRPTVRKMFRP